MYMNMAVSCKSLLYGQDRLVTAWVSQKLGIPDFGACSAIGVMRDNKIIAGAVYNDFRKDHRGQPMSIECTIVSVDKSWLNRHILNALFGYPFSQLKVRRVQLKTAKRNKKLRKMFEALGFKFEGVLRQDWWLGGDAVVYSMLHHECRWIKDP